MKIVTFMYAEAANTIPMPDNQPKTQINGPLLSFFPQYIPTNFSFSIVCGILGIDLSTLHKVRIRFVNTVNGKTLVETDNLPLPVAPEKPQLPVHLNEIVFSIDLRNVVLEFEGEYRTDVFVDNILLGEFPVEVWLKKNGQ